MKKVFYAVVFIWAIGFLCGQCSAAYVLGLQSESVVVAEADPMIDFKGILKETRVGYFVNQHLDKLTGVYASVQRFHTSGKVELCNLNVGYLNNEDTKKESPMLMIGLRLDNLIYRAWRGKWGKAHVTTANLPTIEFGPYASGWLEKDGGKWRVDLYYGAGISVGF